LIFNHLYKRTTEALFFTMPLPFFIRLCRIAQPLYAFFGFFFSDICFFNSFGFIISSLFTKINIFSKMVNRIFIKNSFTNSRNGAIIIMPS